VPLYGILPRTVQLMVTGTLAARISKLFPIFTFAGAKFTKPTMQLFALRELW